MKKISLWAKKNKWAARLLIICIYILLNVLGYAYGILLKEAGVTFSLNLFILVFLLFLTSTTLYPSKKNRKNDATSFYFKQKSCDVILALSSFCMIVYVGNNYNSLSGSYSTVNGTANTTLPFPTDSTIKSYHSISEFKESIKDDQGKSLNWKEKKKLLKKQIKGIQASKDVSDGGKIALIFLSVLVALGLLYLLAALSCSVACSGAEGLAVVIVLLGTGAIIFLLVKVIKGILRKKEREKPEKQIPTVTE